MRTSTASGSIHDFYVHKNCLGVASSVFADMFSIPQPHTQATHVQGVPVICVSETKETMGLLLGLIYPQVVPRIPLPALPPLFRAADKYDIPTILPRLKEALESFLPKEALSVYVVACGAGLPDVVKAATRSSTPRTYESIGHAKLARHLSHQDHFRFVYLLRLREDLGLSLIRAFPFWAPLRQISGCLSKSEHWDQARSFYHDLAGAVERRFLQDHNLKVVELIASSRSIGGLPTGCTSKPRTTTAPVPAAGAPHLVCPLNEELIEICLQHLVQDLRAIFQDLETEVFGEGTGSG